MHFILFCIEFLIILMLGVYLLDMFSIQDYGSPGIAFLFIIGVVNIFIMNEIIKKYKIEKPSKRVLIMGFPAVFAIIYPIIDKAQNPSIVFLVGWILSIPAVVSMVTFFIKRFEKKVHVSS